MSSRFNVSKSSGGDLPSTIVTLRARNFPTLLRVASIRRRDLQRFRRVVLVDYRGVGRSTGQPAATMDGMARDIIAFIRTLGAKQVDIFGFSLGGMVAQQIAADAPELVRRLILAGTGPAGGDGMDEYSPQVKQILSRPGSTADERKLELFFAPSATSQAARRAWLDRVNARQVDREPATSPKVVPAQLAALEAWGAVLAADRYAQLKKITDRTLIVNGHSDIMVPTVNSFILQQKLPDARLIVPDSGHGGHFQFPEEFAEAAARFLAVA